MSIHYGTVYFCGAGGPRARSGGSLSCIGISIATLHRRFFLSPNSNNAAPNTRVDLSVAQRGASCTEVGAETFSDKLHAQPVFLLPAQLSLLHSCVDLVPTTQRQQELTLEPALRSP